MPETPARQAPAPRRNAGFGIASFLVFHVFFIYAVLVVLIGAYIRLGRPGTFAADSPAFRWHVVLLRSLSCLGVALGGAGLTQRNRRKIFTALGLALNPGYFLTFLTRMIVGQ